MDLAQLDQQYLDELTAHHVGGHLKVAPEHSDPETLSVMKKPDIDNFASFGEAFAASSARAGKEQYLVPYFIASHPGSDIDSMIHLAVFLKQNGYRPEQVQDFIPAPFDIAACMYYTGLDPMTMKPVYVAKHLRDRKVQRALMQFFQPENYFVVRRALLDAGRGDLIGDGCDCLIPAKAPREAVMARRERAAHEAKSEDYVHSRARRPGPGYRPGRRGASRRKR